MNARGIPASFEWLLLSASVAACSSEPADELTPQSFAEEVARIKCAANAVCCSIDLTRDPRAVVLRWAGGAAGRARN